MSEIIMARDTSIFLLKHLGFVISLKKCVLDPVQEIEFLGLIVNSQTMTLPLPKENIVEIKSQCLSFYKASEVSLLDLKKLIGILSSAIQAVLPARLQFCFLQQQQITSVLRHFGEADSHGKKRVVMVDQQSRTLQWSIGYTTTDTCPYSDRCIQNKLGGCMSRDQNRGSVVQERTESTYQSAGASVHKVCHLDICQNVANVSYTYLGRQNDSLELFAENGRDKESRSSADLKGNLGVSIWAGDHDYCQTFTRESQLQDRLGISSPKRFFRMETVPCNIQQDIPNIEEKTGNRPVFFEVVKSASKLLLLEARSQQCWHGCSSTELVSQESICIPSIGLDSQSIEKVEEEKVPFLVTVTTTWQTQNWYPDLLRLSVTNRIILPLKDYLLKGPQNQHHLLVQNRTMQLAVCLRRRLAEEGISERASDLIVS